MNMAFCFIDLVAESMDKQCLLIGECKWTSQENATALLSDLRHYYLCYRISRLPE